MIILITQRAQEKIVMDRWWIKLKKVNTEVVTTTVTGMVLSSTSVGDYDKRLVILTKERGRIAVFAKGARRQNSAFLACSQPFSFGEFGLYEGRTSFNLTTVQISNYFEMVRSNLESAYYGMYFCELAAYFTHENDDGTDILKLLYQSLRALTREAIGMQLVRYVYELKLLTLSGVAPQVFQCVKCNEKESDILFKENIYKFSRSSGGLLCRNCSKNVNDIIVLGESTIYTLQYIITSKIEKLYTFTVSPQVMRELKKCVDNYKKLYIERDMKSLKIIEKMF